MKLAREKGRNNLDYGERERERDNNRVSGG
jgi:hypothetical protein